MKDFKHNVDIYITEYNMRYSYHVQLMAMYVYEFCTSVIFWFCIPIVYVKKERLTGGTYCLYLLN